jgi:hypothetical protein
MQMIIIQHTLARILLLACIVPVMAGIHIAMQELCQSWLAWILLLAGSVPVWAGMHIANSRQRADLCDYRARERQGGYVA